MTKYGYDINDLFDREIVLDLPFSELNKRGRKAKRKRYKKKINKNGMW